MRAFARKRASRAPVLGATVASALVVAGCGGGQMQDQKEPRGNFPVALLGASFPSNQKLAKRSQLVISVRNSGARTIPLISVTVKCGSGLGNSFDTAALTPDASDPRRPIFEVDTIPTRITRNRPSLDPAPIERSTAYVDTYTQPDGSSADGSLPPGRTATFRWTLTAVRAVSYRLCWRVNAGLYGKAQAVTAPGSPPIYGEFTGSVSNTAPQVIIGPNGRSIQPAPRG